MEKKQIVFIEFYSSVMIYKIAKLLKEKGYETVLIRLLQQNSFDRDFYDLAFDKVINFEIKHFKLEKNLLQILFRQVKQLKSLFFAFKSVKKLKPYVVFGRSLPNLPIAIFRIIFIKYPFIYFPYDIRSQLDSEFYREKIDRLELKSERFLFEKSNGIMHKGAPEELNPENINGRLLGNNINISGLQLVFHPYCSREFIIPLNKNKLSKKNGEMHFVYVGGVSKLKEEFYEEVLNAFEKIPENKIHLHFYFCYDTAKELDIKKWKKFIEDFMKKCKHPNKKYFHFHLPHNPFDIIKEISKYDFGIGFYDFYTKNGIEPNFSIGNKTSTYLEAGIPFIYPKDYLFLDKLMKKFGSGVSWPNEMNDLKRKFKKFDYKKFEKNILNAREDFLMEKHYKELEDFIEKVVSNRK